MSRKSPVPATEDALTLFQQAVAANATGDPKLASELYYRAFAVNPALNFNLLPPGHPSRLHVYPQMDDRRHTACPFCGQTGQPYWCYYIAQRPNCPQNFNPIRTWLHCAACHHLWSAEPTEYLDDSLLHTSQETAAEPWRFALFARILNDLRAYAPGHVLLEVGVGEGECSAAAAEMGYDVTGIDLTKPCVDYVRRTFGLPVVHGDFLRHDFHQKFDVIVLGDVIEHVRDPAAFIRRSAALCYPGSVLWLSTPNFEAAFTKFAGHDDPMRLEPAHCGYFSYQSLADLLNRHGFDVKNYQISAQYNGSMELTAVYRGDTAPRRKPAASSKRSSGPSRSRAAK